MILPFSEKLEFLGSYSVKACGLEYKVEFHKFDHVYADLLQ